MEAGGCRLKKQHPGYNCSEMDAGNSLTCWPNTADTGEAEIQMAIWTPVNIVKMLIGGFGTVSTEGFDSPANHFGVVYDANTVGS